MLQKCKSNSLLTIENIKLLMDTQRLLETRDDTLFVQFVSGYRIIRRRRVVAAIHDIREAIGWEMTEQFGPIEELLIVGRIGTTTIESVNFRKFPFIRLAYHPISIILSGRNADRTHFADAHQYSHWDEAGNQLWEAPLISISTKPLRNGLTSTLEDIYQGADCCKAFYSKNLS